MYGMDGMHEFYINNGWPNAPFQGGLLGTARLLFVKKSRSAAHREYSDRHPDPKPIHTQPHDAWSAFTGRVN